MKRILHEPAFILHHYDWSESSLILEVFTRNHGRTALLAKGAKRPSSSFRPVLLPLQPLRLNYSTQNEIGTLKGAEWQGQHVMPRGDALLAGYYLNELMLRLLARDDAHPALFDAFAQAAAMLAERSTPHPGDWLQAVLRAFELVLLREIGVLPDLSLQTLTHRPTDAQMQYALRPELGLCLLTDEQATPQRQGLCGGQWHQIQQALDDAVPQHTLFSLCLQHRDMAQALKVQLRELLHYHCGAPMLRTRNLMMELHKL